MHDPLRGRCCVRRVSDTLRSTVTKSSNSVSKGASVQLSKSVLNVTGAPRGVCEGVTVLDGVCEGVGVPVCEAEGVCVAVWLGLGVQLAVEVGDALELGLTLRVAEFEGVPAGVGSPFLT